ncbi:FBP domain-containing protein [Agrococcus sediminis]|uniref:FBP domain-containing protein n=1 Tax=Agrococcus sediminis TaxID=2599924 RepID=A0A5M8Q8V2_9MICO|nr:MULTISPECIES: FBP domain-containing protein [Agrococcus]KAA6431374.1 FBP domain-containing protein [Agrococcus sediminis]RWR24693.1 FBP domain-containing protein [Agrococcus lahaulensis]UOW00174.1 FBP domain-containing protein [Agrococcus sp. SCSIO52902]
MREVTETELRSCFVNATQRELDQMPMPGLHETIWAEREYLGWRDQRSSRIGYLVHWRDDELIGVVVRSAPGGMRPGIAAMCSLCHSTQPATQVRMFSARLASLDGDTGSSIGTYICEDLACSHIIRTGPPHLVSPERVASRGAALLGRVTRFTQRVERASREA